MDQFMVVPYSYSVVALPSYHSYLPTEVRYIHIICDDKHIDLAINVLVTIAILFFICIQI